MQPSVRIRSADQNDLAEIKKKRPQLLRRIGRAGRYAFAEYDSGHEGGVDPMTADALRRHGSDHRGLNWFPLRANPAGLAGSPSGPTTLWIDALTGSCQIMHATTQGKQTAEHQIEGHVGCPRFNLGDAGLTRL